MSDVQCPCTLALHFPSEVYRSAGSSKVLPELVKSLDLPNVRAIQFVPNGIVRVTFKETTQCDAVLADGISFRGAPLRLTPVDSRTRLVYVRDLPVEVPDDGLQAFLRPFGIVHSVLRQTYPGMPDVFTGTRVVKVTLSKDLPSSARVSGFDVRFWYQSQPRACPVCRAFGHRVKDCPFNGKCRRCSQPGHMARECPSRRSTVEPASAAPSVPEASSVADPRMSEDEEADDPDYVPSTASEPGSCSGDKDVITSVSNIVPLGRKRSYSESDAADLYLVDEDEVESAPTVDPVPGKPMIASAAFSPVTSVSGTPVSASAASTPVAGMPVSASAVSTPVSGTPVSASAVSPPVSGTPESASAGPTPAVKPSVPVSGRKKPPPPAVAPPPTKPVPSFWDHTRRRCFAVGAIDSAGESITLEFGILTRSILRDFSTFEVDRFYKYRDRLVARPYLVPRDIPSLSLRPGVPLKFPKSKKFPKSLSGWFS